MEEIKSIQLYQWNFVFFEKHENQIRFKEKKITKSIGEKKKVL